MLQSSYPVGSISAVVYISVRVCCLCSCLYYLFLVPPDSVVSAWDSAHAQAESWGVGAEPQAQPFMELLDAKLCLSYPQTVCAPPVCTISIYLTTKAVESARDPAHAQAESWGIGAGSQARLNL